RFGWTRSAAKAYFRQPSSREVSSINVAASAFAASKSSGWKSNWPRTTIIGSLYQLHHRRPAAGALDRRDKHKIDPFLIGTMKQRRDRRVELHFLRAHAGRERAPDRRFAAADELGRILIQPLQC